MRTYVIFFAALLLWSAPAFGELSQEEIQAIANATAAQVITEISEIKTEISEIKTEISAMKVEISTVKTELSETKVELSAVRTELSETRAEVSEMKGEVRGQSQRITDQRFILIGLFSLVLIGGGFLYRKLDKLQESVQEQQKTIAVLKKTYELLKPQTAIHQGESLEPGNGPEPAETYYGRGKTYYDEGEFDRVICDFDKAIELKSVSGGADRYYYRGFALLYKGEWDKAKADLTVAKNRGVDIIASFQNDYENVADFEKKNGVTVPADIKEMLTQR